jgi:glycosyltransferase involved in cell wall biosynthesis
VRRAAVVADGRGFGGAQVYARSLVAHAPAHLACDVVTTAEHAPHLRTAVEARSGRLVVVDSTVGAGTAPALRDAVAALRPDIVQVNLVDPTSMVAALEACVAVAPTVATLHMRGDVPTAERDRVRAAYAALRHVVAVSREFADLARDVLLVPADRLTHVVNGVDPLEPVTPPGGPVPVVGALGRLTPQKGFDVLLEAVRLLTQRGVALELLLGGEGRERPALERQAAGLPVRFAGLQDGPRELLSRVDVFCLPSRAEGLPLVLVEAVSAGLPAVATDVGDVRLALDDVALVVPPEDAAALADALERLLVAPDERRHRGRRGVLVARARLTAERMAGQAWAAFGASLEQPPPPARR